MVFLTYEQYAKAIEVIDSVTDAAGTVTATALVEIPVIGPIIGALLGTGLGKLLAWGLKQILKLIPHENEPRPDKFGYLKLYDPKSPPTVLPPNFRPLDTEDKISDAIMDLSVSTKMGTLYDPAPEIKPIFDRVQPAWDWYHTTVPIYDDGKDYSDIQKINIYKQNPLNPTFDHPGFSLLRR